MNEPIYTHALWRVREGHEHDFIAAWRRLAAAFSALPSQPAGKGVLIQSTTDATVFYSFGAWHSEADVASMRSDPHAQAAISRVRELCTEATPGTYRVVAEVDPRVARSSETQDNDSR